MSPIGSALVSASDKGVEQVTSPSLDSASFLFTTVKKRCAAIVLLLECKLKYYSCASEA